MLYFIKTIYKTFLLPPGIIIVFLAILSFISFRKKHKISKFILVATIALYLFSIPLVGEFLIGSLEKEYFPPENPSGDVIIMLGAGATLDTPNVNGKGHLSGYAANRLLTVAQLYKKLDVPIILSGGQVFGFTGKEADIAKEILIGIGIPEEKIITEGKSLNTTQNAQYTKEIIMQYEFRDPIVVTSAFHMPRAVKQFEKVDVQVEGYPTDYQTNINKRYSFYDFIPSASSINYSSLAIKEYIGILVAKWY
ncbi:YdcF family protein [Clostridium sp. DL1XJH146]